MAVTATDNIELQAGSDLFNNGHVAQSQDSAKFIAANQELLKGVVKDIQGWDKGTVELGPQLEQRADGKLWQASHGEEGQDNKTDIGKDVVGVEANAEENAVGGPNKPGKLTNADLVVRKRMHAETVFETDPKLGYAIAGSDAALLDQMDRFNAAFDVDLRDAGQFSSATFDGQAQDRVRGGVEEFNV